MNDSNSCSSLSAMNVQKRELFSGSLGTRTLPRGAEGHDYPHGRDIGAGNWG